MSVQLLRTALVAPWYSPLGLQSSNVGAVPRAAQAVVQLEEQYRMNASVMLLANSITYGHQLTCGTQAVAEATLALGQWAQWIGSSPPAWLVRAIDPSRSVVFLDTSEASQRCG